MAIVFLTTFYHQLEPTSQVRALCLSRFYLVDHWFQCYSGEYTIFVEHSPLRATLASYSTIRQDLRPEVRRSSRTCSLSWRKRQKLRTFTINFMLFGLFHPSFIAMVCRACITMSSGVASLWMWPVLYCHWNKSSSTHNAREMVSPDLLNTQLLPKLMIYSPRCCNLHKIWWSDHPGIW